MFDLKIMFLLFIVYYVIYNTSLLETNHIVKHISLLIYILKLVNTLLFLYHYCVGASFR